LLTHFDGAKRDHLDLARHPTIRFARVIDHVTGLGLITRHEIQVIVDLDRARLAVFTGHLEMTAIDHPATEGRHHFAAIDRLDGERSRTTTRPHHPYLGFGGQPVAVQRSETSRNRTTT
jgi:hypothetical protein